MRMSRVALMTLLLVAAAANLALAARYEIVGADSEVVFESRAPMETFKGKTREISGWFAADLANLAGSVELEVEVQLASFDTGLGKRNQHMRDNHLETDTYPVARFTAGAIVLAEPGSLTAGQPVRLTLRGTLDLHGVQKEMDCQVDLQQEADGTLAIAGTFPVLLSDFNIDRPKFLVLKLADEQKVMLDLSARPIDEGVQP
jgi:polyisoprenoid-binding protein YceI